MPTSRSSPHPSPCPLAALPWPAVLRDWWIYPVDDERKRMTTARIFDRFPDQMSKLIDDSPSAEPASRNVNAKEGCVRQVPPLWMPELRDRHPCSRPTT